MAPSASPSRSFRVALGVLALCAAACQRAASSQPIVGPDGSAMAHVHCGSDQGTCFRIAGELCPSGYDLKPVLRGADGNFLVRCRAAAAAVTAAVTPPERPAPCPASPSWPSVETTAGVRAKATPVPPEEIDLGY